MRKRYPLLGFILLLLLLTVGGGGFFASKLSFNEGLRSFFEELAPYSDLKTRVSELERENENLKSQILIQELTDGPSVPVYSSYPFNNRSEIAVAVGEKDGISEGDIVTYGENILVGRVKQIASDTSIVTTIFDPGFETAVRIGPGAVDALLKGGNRLSLSLIPKESSIEEGDIIFTAGAEFPYGLEIGRVRDVRESDGDVFKSAGVNPAFEVKALRDVVIRP